MLAAAGLAGGLRPAPQRPWGAVIVDGTCRLAERDAGPLCRCDQVPADLRLALGRPLDLNRAPATALEGLPHIGPVRAAAIEAERARSGPYTSLEDLSRRVRGIGPRTSAQLAPHVFVGRDPGCAAVAASPD
jgi:competence protein ComEA